MSLGAQLKSVAKTQEQINSAAAREAAGSAQRRSQSAVDAIAEDFRTELLKGLKTKLAKEARAGRFEFVVYKSEFGSPDTVRTEAHKGRVQGLRLVAEWLVKNGLTAEVIDHGETVMDYGYVHMTQLIARWA